jgi:hypothetical protein
MVKLPHVAVSVLLSVSAFGFRVGAQERQSVSLDTPGLRNPVLVTSCTPYYTADALRAGISGSVVLRIQLGADGADLPLFAE